MGNLDDGPFVFGIGFENRYDHWWGYQWCQPMGIGGFGNQHLSAHRGIGPLQTKSSLFSCGECLPLKTKSDKFFIGVKFHSLSAKTRAHFRNQLDVRRFLKLSSILWSKNFYHSIGLWLVNHHQSHNWGSIG